MHTQDDNSISVAALYLFADLRDEKDFMHSTADAIESQMLQLDIRGTLILAEEGINGTIAGTPPAIDRMLNYLRSSEVFCGKLSALTPSLSSCEHMPFERSVVKVRPEIVTMGVPGIDPTSQAGQYVEPHEWNDLIDDPDVLVIDTRNAFEVDMGTFVSEDGRPATDPKTVCFRDFPAFAKRELEAQKDKTVAMFCTGGIRCEKATSYLLSLGFRDVRHLKGGILGYLRVTDPSVSRWQGGCFVFDQRTQLGHGLVPLDSQESCPKPH